MLKYHKWQV